MCVKPKNNKANDSCNRYKGPPHLFEIVVFTLLSLERNKQMSSASTLKGLESTLLNIYMDLRLARNILRDQYSYREQFGVSLMPPPSPQEREIEIRIDELSNAFQTVSIQWYILYEQSTPLRQQQSKRRLSQLPSDFLEDFTDLLRSSLYGRVMDAQSYRVRGEPIQFPPIFRYLQNIVSERSRAQR
jgi:hypothetical protein